MAKSYFYSNSSAAYVLLNLPQTVAISYVELTGILERFHSNVLNWITCDRKNMAKKFETTISHYLNVPSYLLFCVLFHFNLFKHSHHLLAIKIALVVLCVCVCVTLQDRQTVRLHVDLWSLFRLTLSIFFYFSFFAS